MAVMAGGGRCWNLRSMQARWPSRTATLVVVFGFQRCMLGGLGGEGERVGVGGCEGERNYLLQEAETLTLWLMKPVAWAFTSPRIFCASISSLSSSPEMKGTTLSRMSMLLTPGYPAPDIFGVG